MRKGFLIVFLGVVILGVIYLGGSLAGIKLGKSSECTRIQDGTLLTSDGEQITTGYDEWGYNYQSHLFNGMYCDYHPAVRPGGPSHDWCMANYGDVELLMKWNDAWLSNKDCDGDSKLDRHFGSPVYPGSGAWETNHMWGDYEMDGEICKWDYFVKIVAKPTPEYNCEEEDGREIWGSFCEIMSVYNDPCAGQTGVEFKAVRPGLGNW